MRPGEQSGGDEPLMLVERSPARCDHTGKDVAPLTAQPRPQCGAGDPGGRELADRRQPRLTLEEICYTVRHALHPGVQGDRASLDSSRAVDDVTSTKKPVDQPMTQATQ
jgi:hypothetical protein